MSTSKFNVSARQQAEAELRKEARDDNVKLFKSKIRDLRKAQKIVRNLEADIAELEVELADDA